MNSFVKEPQRLAAERQRLHNELVQASLEHYPVFLQCAHAATQAQADVQTGRITSSRLCKDVDSLEKGCTAFAEIGAQWKAGRTQAAHLLNNHSKLLELLEVPQLLETCLRSEMYHEALLVHDHVQALAEANLHIPLVRMIADEVESTMRQLLVQILGKLSQDLSLAVCMKIVAFLSRLKVMPEKEFRVLFLQKRFQYLQAALAEAAPHAASPSSYMSKVTSVIKIQVFDILTQYQSVFPAPKDPRDGLDAPVCDVVAGWLLAVLDQYFEDLRKHVGQISSGSELRSLLDQCMNCGYTLARLNVDIRGLMVPIFTQRVVELYSAAAEQAYRAFAQAMVGYRWSASRTPAHPRRGSVGPNGAPGAKVAPPPGLLQYPPLGHATNAFLTAFNEIRRCAPVSVAHDCAAITARVLQSVVDDIVKIHETTPFEAPEEARFLAFVPVAAEDFVGYICRCLDCVFDQPQLLVPSAISAPLLSIGARGTPAPAVPPPPPPIPASSLPPSTPVASPLIAASAPTDTPAHSEPTEGYDEYAGYEGGDVYPTDQPYDPAAAWTEGQEAWTQEAWGPGEGEAWQGEGGQWEEGQWQGGEWQEGHWQEGKEWDPGDQSGGVQAAEPPVPSPPKGKKAD
jgi:hypothetical protein